MQTLLVKLKSLESSWRSANRQLLRGTAGSTIAAAPVPSPPGMPTVVSTWQQPQAVARPPLSFEHCQTPVAQAPSAPLSNSYCPENVSFVAKDRQQFCAYHIPYSGQTIFLGHNCHQCGQPHFNFEHQHLAPIVKAKNCNHLATNHYAEATAYGYPLYEPVDEALTLKSTRTPVSHSLSRGATRPQCL